MKDEKSQFRQVVNNAKSAGFSKGQTLDKLKPLHLRIQMEWMLTPVTAPRSQSLARDLAKLERLESYIKENWKSERKLKEVV